MPTPMPCSHYLYHYYGVLAYSYLLAVVVHAVTAYQLVKENRAARPNRNDIEKTQRAGIRLIENGSYRIHPSCIHSFSPSTFHNPHNLS